MNYRKVYGGTPVGSQSRCDTCVNGLVIKGYSANERITVCTAGYPSLVVPFPVYECSEYLNRSLPQFEDMEEIALDLTVDRAPRTAGFLRRQNGGRNSQQQDENDE